MITKGIVRFKLRCLQKEFIKRKLEYTDILALLLYHHCLQKIKEVYPHINIEKSEECYNSLLNQLERNNENKIIQNDHYFLVMEFIELSKLTSNNPYTKLERYLTATHLIQTNENAYMDSNFIKVNFVTDCFPSLDCES